MSKCLKDFLAVTGENYKVFHGSNLDVLPFMADNSVDSIVTDPPYELGFMGKSWDSSGIAYSVELWRECLRVLKPGGHLLAFGGSRTWHRLAVAIEDSGFEVRDSIAWLYGSGFPKSHDISKAIDKAAGAERDEWPTLPMQKKSDVGEISKNRRCAICLKALASGNPCQCDRTSTAITPEAQQWQGWGTALKPAFEPVVVARKPLVGTVAANVLEWGTGGLNIDATRIGTEERINQPAGNKANSNGVYKFSNDEINAFNGAESTTVSGRWPANIILDEFTAELLDKQSGISTSKVGKPRGTNKKGLFANSDFNKVGTEHNDTGGASRFFYVAKANKRDRNEGLDGLPEIQTVGGGGLTAEVREDGSLETASAGGKYGSIKAKQTNHHPTVKPTDLMRYLIKLVTPPNGTVLDPFTGSGSTGKAALLDGYQFIGIELTEDYLPIIEGRLRWANEQNKETLFDE
jgi:DNA modification methylase